MIDEQQPILPFADAIEAFNHTRGPPVFPNVLPHFGATTSTRTGDPATVAGGGRRRQAGLQLLLGWPQLRKLASPR